MFKKMKERTLLISIAAVGCLIVIVTAFTGIYPGYEKVKLKTAERGNMCREYVFPDTPVPEEDKVNINTASAEELDALPYIGPKRAAAIIDHRQKHGEFTSLSQLTLVDGIGEEIYEKIKDLCTI